MPKSALFKTRPVPHRAIPWIGHQQIVFGVSTGYKRCLQIRQAFLGSTSNQMQHGMTRIKVMVVDNSAVVRQVLTGLLNEEPDIKVIAAVANPILAMPKMKIQWPDVFILDVDMPRMDGISFLKKIMSERPTPVVIFSTLAASGTKTSIEARTAGAVASITKPTIGLMEFLIDSSDDLVTAVRVASKAHVRRTLRPSGLPPPLVKEKFTADVIMSAADEYTAMLQTTERVVALGTSTGGTLALEEVLIRLPRVTPGIVIVQHMPEKFTAEFANRLNSLCQIEVREAQDNDRVIPGRALIAPGNRHMLLRRTGVQYYVEVIEGRWSTGTGPRSMYYFAPSPNAPVPMPWV